MTKILKLMIFTILFQGSFTLAKVIELNEKSLIQYSLKGSPELDRIEALLHSVKSQQGEVKGEFAPELYGGASHAETRELAIMQFQPVFSPIAQAQLGVRQRLNYGLSTSAQLVTDQRRSSSSPTVGTFDDVTTTTLSFTLKLDLWKDLLGRVSKGRLENAELEIKRAKIEREIQVKAFQISLRRLYWSLVANQEALKISEELLKTAQVQSSEAQKRFRNAVAESDEVARYEAQVFSRQGSLLFLKYQREILIKQMMGLVPELSSAEIILDDYDLDKTLKEVLACTSTIARESKVPYQFTRYDEIIRMLGKIRSNNQFLNSRYSDVDVQLFATLQSRGVDSNQVSAKSYRGSYGGSFDQVAAGNRMGHEVGVQFVLPLGEVKDSTKKSKEIYDDKRLLALINSFETQLLNTHSQLIKTVDILNGVIRAKKKTSLELNKRLQGMKRKYEQARISVNELILDQDALLNSELTSIDTQLQILNTIFDYLLIYTDTPCNFNRI